VVTSSLTVGLLQGQLKYLQERGFDIAVVSPAGRQLDELAQIEGVRTIEVPMARNISPLRDFGALWRLWRVVCTLRPTMINVGTPKAGLLGGFAAWVNRVPCRFYTLRGLRFETTRGLRRWLLVHAERLACRFAHRVICVSESVREKAVNSGITSAKRTVVFRSGSSNGVDASRFAPTPEMLKRASAFRSELGIPPEAPIMGFVGRLTRDKGIPELVEAFLRLSDRFPNLWLLLVGRFEDEDPLPAQTLSCLRTHPRVILPGHQQAGSKADNELTYVACHCNSRFLSRDSGQKREDWPVEQTAPYYAMMDIFVLPTHREGFPNVVLEAQAAGKPVVAARATGVVDAIVDGKTGLLFPVGDAVALADAATRLLSDKALADKLGCAGQERVKHEFRQEQIWEALYQEYVRLLETRHLPLPQMHMDRGDWISGRGSMNSLLQE
jgi:glycosyltransferase involved in cell wall biosynthesis